MESKASRPTIDVAGDDALRDHYPQAIERARLKTLHKLDQHCRRFIALSPFLCLGTSGKDGADVTPRGDRPGFVKVLDDSTLAVNGTAEIRTDPDLLAAWEVNGNRPKSALLIRVSETFLHCGKALIRSRLWQNDYRIDRSELPSYGRMLKDQIEIRDSAEEIEASVAEAYKDKLC
jgi:predicted pyridoxine 5'-phosphate oxidase superfamily flavin-nucleotide-binding protein